MTDPLTPAQPSKWVRKIERCPYCGDIDYDCEDPFKCQREIAADERDQMEREIQEVRERYGYY